MDEFKNLDVAGLINDDNVADFTLNYRLAYNYFDDLFEGDDKFYKSSQDFLKRAKEGQASGTPYSTFNIYQDENMMLTDLKKMSYLNSQAIQDKLNSLGLHVTQRPGFVGITIKNTVRTSEECKVAKVYPDGRVEGEDGILVKDLVKNAKLTLEQARDLMGGPILLII